MFSFRSKYFYSFVGFIADVPSRLLFVCGFYRGSCECFLAVYVQATLLEQTLRRSFLSQTTTKNNVAAICFTLWPGCVTYMCFSGGGRWSWVQTAGKCKGDYRNTQIYWLYYLFLKFCTFDSVAVCNQFSRALWLHSLVGLCGKHSFFKTAWVDLFINSCQAELGFKWDLPLREHSGEPKKGE